MEPLSLFAHTNQVPFAPIIGTYLDDISAFCWLIVALGTGYGVMRKECSNPIECSALAILSIATFARAWAVWQRDIVTPDSLLVSMSAAIYVLVRYYQSWQKGKSKS